jgi:N-acetylmuramic acid 6-phosphate etherase
MVARIAGCDMAAAAGALDAAGDDVKLAVLLARGMQRPAAEQALRRHGGNLRRALAD